MEKGFTLIELLVVMIIISMLVGISIASMTKSQKNSRDARRKADIAVVQSALESYYNQKKEYPASADNCVDATNWECDHKGSTVWISGLVNYAEKLGKDPKPVAFGYPSISSAGSPPIGGPIAGSEDKVNYYGYYSFDKDFDCASPSPVCPYKNVCSDLYSAKSYYILAAVLENANDSETIKNSAVPKYFLNCEIMKGNPVYNQNAYVKISVF